MQDMPYPQYTQFILRISLFSPSLIQLSVTSYKSLYMTTCNASKRHTGPAIAGTAIALLDSRNRRRAIASSLLSKLGWRAVKPLTPLRR